MNTRFLAGAAACDLTPPQGAIDNSLHPNMRVRLDEHGSRLQAKALTLSLGEKRVLLVALDIGFVPTPHCDVLRQAISEATGVSPSEIVICPSHSHSTPFIEPLPGPHPWFDFVKQRAIEVAGHACRAQQPARFGQGRTHVVGASFNTQVFLPGNRVKLTRDFREGLASGRPIDPRLCVIRIDDAQGRPIAGWIYFAAHPSCVIFNAPISAEYPGYLTEQLTETITHGAPVLFGLGACGDINCIPMFGTENDARNLGLNLAQLVAPVFERITTAVPRRLLTGTRRIELPLDAPPSLALLDQEIAEVNAFIAALDQDPTLEWVLGFNCKKDWSVADKKASARPLAAWAQHMKEAIRTGQKFPATWPSEITAWVLDDLALLFYPGEPLTEVGLAIAAASPGRETLLVALANGSEGYIGSDENRRRGGYRMYTSQRYSKPGPRARPFPYALGAADVLQSSCLELLQSFALESIHASR